jgi:glycosyltransferase involved in cell wall biosynthesis
MHHSRPVERNKLQKRSEFTLAAGPASLALITVAPCESLLIPDMPITVLLPGARGNPVVRDMIRLRQYRMALRDVRMLATARLSPDAALTPPALPMRARSHIAIYVPSLIGGGAERVAALLASALSAAGQRITLVVDFEAPHNDNFVAAGVERVTLAGTHGSDILRLAEFLKRQRPDIALAVGAVSNVKLVVAHLLARVIGAVPTRIVLSYHGLSSAGRGGWLSWFAFVLAALLTRYAARTICVSDHLARHLAGVWHGARSRIVRIYNPVAIDRTKPATEANDLAARPPIVIALGMLCATKGYATLLEAMALLPRPDARLVICGEGSDRDALEHLAERLGVGARVEWRGYVTDPWEEYAGARCFALASVNESFSNVVVEALASGIPVVSTDCGGPAEILDDGRLGTLVPVGDAAALSAAIARALEEPGEPAPRLARAREFAAPTIAARYLALFEDILSPSPKGAHGVSISRHSEKPRSVSSVP